MAIYQCPKCKVFYLTKGRLVVKCKNCYKIKKITYTCSSYQKKTCGLDKCSLIITEETPSTFRDPNKPKFCVFSEGLVNWTKKNKKENKKNVK